MSALQRLQEFRYKKSQAASATPTTKSDRSNSSTAPASGSKDSSGMAWPSTTTSAEKAHSTILSLLAQSTQASKATRGVSQRHDLGSEVATTKANSVSSSSAIRTAPGEHQHRPIGFSSISAKQPIGLEQPSKPSTPFKELVGSFRYSGENSTQFSSRNDTFFDRSSHNLARTTKELDSSDDQGDHAAAITGQKRAARRHQVRRHIVSSDDDEEDLESGSGGSQKMSRAPPVVEKRRRLVRKSELIDSDSQGTFSKASSPVDISDSDTGDMTHLDERLAQLQSTFPETPFAELRKVLLEAGGEYSAAARSIACNSSSSVFSLENSSNRTQHAVTTKSVMELRRESYGAASSNSVRLQRLSLRRPTGDGSKTGRTESSDVDSDVSEDPFDGLHKDEDKYQVLREEATLQFFNDAPPHELIELAGCSKAQAASIISLRPFSDIESLHQKLRSTKGVSARIVDSYQTTTDAIRDVDRMLTNVEHVRQDIMGALNRWGKMGINGFPELPLSTDEHTENGLDEKSLETTESCVIDQFIDTQPSIMADGFKLKSYQLLGMNWLALLWRKKLSGILADEMGLGKTAQVIAFLAHLLENNEKGPFLVIVPSSTLSNWLRELNRFCPALDVRSYYGSQSEREELRYELSEDTSYNVVVTTYAVATGNNDERKFLSRRGFKGVILDEGHMVKNCTSARYKQLMNIKADFRLLLTGTPLQNNLEELLSLVVFILPTLFADHEDVLRTMFKIKPDARTETSSLLSKERIARARHLISPFILRRKKTHVLKELPPKTVKTIYCDLDPRQKALYDRITSSSAFQQGMVESPAVKPAESTPKAKSIAEPAVDHSNAILDPQSSATKEDEGFVNVLMQLRKIAVHPMLCRDLYTQSAITKLAKLLVEEPSLHGSEVPYIIEDLMVMTDFEIHRMCEKYKSTRIFALKGEPWMSAGKVKELNRILPPLLADGSSKVLIFSQFTMALDILEVVMETMDLKYLRMDGQTKVDTRQEIIDTFNEDKTYKVLLLSTKAGGFGINLTGANTVIMYDLDFNPHNDKQAEDRVHRVGQTRPVEVIKLVTKGTVEEQILELANIKLQLDEHISQTHTDIHPQSKQTANSLNSGFLRLVKQNWKSTHENAE